MHTRDAVLWRDETKIRERLDQIGHTVVTLCDRIGARRDNDFDTVVELFRDQLREFVKRLGNTGGDIERAGALAKQTTYSECRNVVHVDMIARLLATAKQRDFPVLLCSTAKAVRSVGVVGIAQAVYQRRT